MRQQTQENNFGQPQQSWTAKITKSILDSKDIFRRASHQHQQAHDNKPAKAKTILVTQCGRRQIARKISRKSIPRLQNKFNNAKWAASKPSQKHNMGPEQKQFRKRIAGFASAITGRCSWTSFGARISILDGNFDVKNNSGNTMWASRQSHENNPQTAKNIRRHNNVDQASATSPKTILSSKSKTQWPRAKTT